MAPVGDLRRGKVHYCAFRISTTFVMANFYTALVGAVVLVGKENIPYDQTELNLWHRIFFFFNLAVPDLGCAMQNLVP